MGARSEKDIVHRGSRVECVQTLPLLLPGLLLRLLPRGNTIGWCDMICHDMSYQIMSVQNVQIQEWLGLWPGLYRGTFVCKIRRYTILLSVSTVFPSSASRTGRTFLGHFAFIGAWLVVPPSRYSGGWRIGFRQQAGHLFHLLFKWKLRVDAIKGCELWWVLWHLLKQVGPLTLSACLRLHWQTERVCHIWIEHVCDVEAAFKVGWQCFDHAALRWV